MMCNHLCSLVAYPLGCSDGLARFAECFPSLSSIPSGISRHWSVCGANSFQTVTMCKTNTTLEVTVRAHHVTAHIFGITKPAECFGFALRCTRFTSQLETSLVLAETALDVTARKRQIAAQKPEL